MVENQDRANYRLPIFINEPIKHRLIICEPLLEKIDISLYLNLTVNQVIVGGESGNEARVCHYDWVLNIRQQCMDANVPFHFKQTAAKLKKDGRIFKIERKFQPVQTKKANIDFNS